MRVILVDPWIYKAGLAMVMDLALLWSTGRILRRQTRKWRLAGATLAGGIYQFILGIRWEMGVVNALDWLVYLAVGVLLILGTYPPKNLRQACRSVFLFFLLTFITVGASMSLLSIARVWGWPPIAPWQFLLLNLMALGITVEIGWGAIHEAIWTQSCLVDLSIGIGGKELTVKAFIDTGNHLRDPLSRAPVIVLSLPMVLQDLPTTLLRTMMRTSSGELLTKEEEAEWGGRLRFIPMASVERNGGMLVGIVPDYFHIKEHAVQNGGSAVVAFSNQRFPDGDFQAIIPTSLFYEETSTVMRRQKHAAIN